MKVILDPYSDEKELKLPIGVNSVRIVVKDVQGKEALIDISLGQPGYPDVVVIRADGLLLITPQAANSIIMEVKR